MMSIMKPPTYGHFDPTPLVAVSFTFFYGLILGDIGYGLLILLIAWWAKRKWGHIPVAKDALTIFQYMGYSSIFFGVIFLEFFGDVIEHTFHIHPLFNRVTQSSTMLAITVLIGAVHVVLGLAIGIRENYKHHHHHHAEEKLGMLLGLFALVAAIGAGSLGAGATAGYVVAGLLAVASLFYLVKSMGFMTPMGVIEVIGLTSNILSYARLTALGIAAIAFTQIANGMTRVESFGLFLVLLIPAALIHAVNFGLSVFSPTIHSLRLNVVEFLPKFYNPAGRNYEPFRKDLVW
jgi:V/A-type H+-transporting ATPase subunit I